MLTLAISKAVRLSDPQLRFVWLPTETCVLHSIESFELTLIATLITDIALLLIVLVGLLRLRCPGGCSFALGRLLWNQVRWCLFPQHLMLSKFTRVPHMKGCPLALACHRRRGPASGMSLSTYFPTPSFCSSAHPYFYHLGVYYFKYQQ